MTTLRRAADTAFSYTLTVQDTAGNLVTPTATPTARMFTDTARTTGEVVLTVTATAQPQVFTVTGPATVQSQRYLKHLIPTALGTRVDADDDLLFEGVTGGVGDLPVTLAEIKAHLQIPTAQTSQDDKLLAYATAYLRVLEDMIGGPLVARSVTETHYRSGPTVVLREGPVLSVQSVDDDGTVLASTDYLIDVHAAILYTECSRDEGRFRVLPEPLTVSYTAGYSPVPANLKQALLLLIQINFDKEQQGHMPGYGGDLDQPAGGPTMGYVRTLVAPHVRSTGFA